MEDARDKGATPAPADAGDDDALSLVHATVRLNASIFGVILGLLTGIALLALAFAAGVSRHGHAGLLVALLGVFLPGYGRSFGGALAGLFWGFVAGGGLGAGIYLINYRYQLGRFDEFVTGAPSGGDFPRAVLRLHGPALGLALGTVGALGLVATTNWLVLRGTAAQSVHARLLAQVFPGYSVTFTGSLVGAAELFALVFAFCVVFARIYNAIVDLRQGAVISARPGARRP